MSITYAARASDGGTRENCCRPSRERKQRAEARSRRPLPISTRARPARFGAVERLVGAVDDAFAVEVVAVVGGGDAAAEGDVPPSAFSPRWNAGNAERTTTATTRAAGPGWWEGARTFAAIAAGDVVSAERAAMSSATLNSTRSPGSPWPYVSLTSLEVIDVDVMTKARTDWCQPTGVRGPLAKPASEVATVVEAGQRRRGRVPIATRELSSSARADLRALGDGRTFAQERTAGAVSRCDPSRRPRGASRGPTCLGAWVMIITTGMVEVSASRRRRFSTPGVEPGGSCRRDAVERRRNFSSATVIASVDCPLAPSAWRAGSRDGSSPRLVAQGRQRGSRQAATGRQTQASNHERSRRFRFRLGLRQGRHRRG